jgi:hypothetical protein
LQNPSDVPDIPPSYYSQNHPQLLSINISNSNPTKKLNENTTFETIFIVIFAVGEPLNNGITEIKCLNIGHISHHNPLLSAVLFILLWLLQL